MRDKSDEGAWAVIRYLPFDTSEGELPAHFDGWFTHRDAAEAVAKDWAGEYPEATVVVVVHPGRFLASSEGEQQNPPIGTERLPSSTEAEPVSAAKRRWW
jgi:hypothetical protein